MNSQTRIEQDLANRLTRNYQRGRLTLEQVRRAAEQHVDSDRLTIEEIDKVVEAVETGLPYRAAGMRA